jgi:hypothetical protein
LILAFKTLFQHCKNIEILGVIRVIYMIHARQKDGRIWDYGRSLEEDVELNVAEVPMCSRQDAVEEWCRTTLWNCIEYGELERYEYKL